MTLTSNQPTMTLADIRSLAYFFADEQPNVIFPANQADRFINIAYAKLARHAGLETTAAYTTTVDGQASYELVDPIMERGNAVVSRVRWNGIRLYAKDPSTIGDLTTEGTPSAYYVDGEAVCLWPVPTTAEALDVTYRKTLTPLSSDSDEAALQYDACELLAIYAAYRMKSKDDEHAAADRLKAQWDEGVRALAGPRPGVYKG